MSDNKNKAYTYKDEYERRYGENGKKERAKVNSAQRAAKDESEGSKEDRLLCLLCYLGPLFLVPYLTQRGSDFAAFHSNQGLLLLIFSLLGQFLSLFVPLLGWTVRLGVAVLVFIGMVMGMYNVLTGKKTELPFIGWIRILP